MSQRVGYKTRLFGSFDVIMQDFDLVLTVQEVLARRTLFIFDQSNIAI